MYSAPLARWKRAVHHIIRQRTMRSQWYSVLCQARQHRAELVWSLVRDFEDWKDMRPDAALRLCAHATLNVFEHGAAVYSKDDEVIESVYVIVSGSVTIQQPTTVTSAGQPLQIASGPYTNELATARIVVRVLKQESCFGEFELLTNSAKRVASATVSTVEARVLSITKDAFLQFWPHRSQMETKLQLLQQALLPILPLDDAQLCCLYYVIRERTFQREQGQCTMVLAHTKANLFLT
jgi:CRP-like cAMP-binding protein